ncbi:hypothetical protein KKC06_06335, partial [Patescibacteria group bacterium]|nr:hypothetical protein [Patescibacteria group bacterium]
MIIKSNKGQTLLIAVIFLAVTFMLGSSLFAYVMSNQIVSQRAYNTQRTYNIAEAGIHKAVWCLNNSDICGSGYSGETTDFSTGQFTTTVTSVGQDYVVTSIGSSSNIEKTIKVTITQNVTTADASFFYGVQVGDGGLTMDNNSYVDGNIYSNGSIDAGSGAYVTGDVYVAGGTALTADQEHTTQNAEFSFGRYDSDEDIAQSFTPGVTEVINYISLYIKKVGNAANATVYITEDNGGEPATSSLAQGTLQANLITTSFGWVDVSFTSNPELTLGTQYWIVIDVGTPKSSKYYIIGQDDQIIAPAGTGARYSSDWLSGNWSTTDGHFNFKTWMGGLDTHIDGLLVGANPDGTRIGHNCDDAHYAIHHGDAHAHTITNSDIECDAFYDVDPIDIAGTTVGRNSHPNSDDPPPEVMPISLQQIQEWKDTAAAVEPHNGDYTIDGTQEELGPLKITGNLTIANSAQLTLTGTLWVEGNIEMSNNAIISLDPGYGNNSGLIITDGKITV